MLQTLKLNIEKRKISAFPKKKSLLGLTPVFTSCLSTFLASNENKLPILFGLGYLGLLFWFGAHTLI